MFHGGYFIKIVNFRGGAVTLTGNDLKVKILLCNIGERKQQEWINKLKEIVDETPSMRPSVKRIVDVIFDHENIPRKKPKVCILIQ